MMTTNQNDVELKLLEPLLIGLGFKEDDWVKQYSVQIVRDKPPRPAGYIIGLRDTSSGQRAQFVFYVTLTLADAEQRREFHERAIEDGGMLSPNSISLVAKEGIWIYKHSDGFDFDKGLEYSWAQLESPEIVAGHFGRSVE